MFAAIIRFVLALALVYVLIGLVWFGFLAAMAGGWDFSTRENQLAGLMIILEWPAWIYAAIELA